MLCRGIRSCIDAVHTIIGRMFDCSTITLPAMEDDLSWLIPIIIMPTSNSNGTPVDSGQIQMEYAVSQLPVTDTITVKFHISDLQKILTAYVSTLLPYCINMIRIKLHREAIVKYYIYLFMFVFLHISINCSIMNPNDDSMINTALDRKHVEMFYDVLHTQMLRMGDLQLGLCTLRKISLPGVTITNNRVNFCLYYMETLLKYLFLHTYFLNLIRPVYIFVYSHLS